MNKVMVFAGVSTLLQAVGQAVLTSLALAQYFCVIDFLRELPILLYIRILYFHKPDSCGMRITIGQSIEELANQAFVLLTQEPFTAFRTFIINCINLGLSILWIMASTLLMRGGSRNKQSKNIRWPWIIVTVASCGVDLVATVTYANDSFQTRTMSDMMDFIGGVSSGTAGVELDTSWASWLMVMVYSRFVILFLLNLLLIVLIVLNYEIKPEPVSTFVQVDAPSVVAHDTFSDKDVEEASLPSETKPSTRIPRPGLSQSFRRMKTLLFKRSPTPEARCRTMPDSLDGSPDGTLRALPGDADKKRTVNFPESLLSLPQRLENLIAEQQRRLDKAVIDTAGRSTATRVSQSMPQLATTSNMGEAARGRRGTTAELQSQLPWAYIPASAHRMRDQLPPDEDLPPVPLPDYTAIQSYRKASVHRAASSISSLTHKKDYALSQSARPPLIQSDVLY